MSKPFISGFLGSMNPNLPATIANGQTVSGAIALGGLTLCGIILPAAFTGTAISFQMSDAIDGTFVAVKSTTSGTALSYTVAQNTYCAIDPRDFQGIAFLKIVSGTAEGGARTLGCAVKGF